MTPYQTKVKKLPGRRYTELRAEALRIFKELRRRTKRKPYVRSAYFTKQKVFFDVQVKENTRTDQKFFISCFPNKDFR